MVSTYTTNGGIEKIGSGEQSGAWGTTTNTNFDIIDRLINGVGAITLSGTTHTLTTTDGSLTDGMFKVLVLGGSPSGTNTITISPNDADKLYFVKNASGESAIFSQGSGANVTVANGKGAIIFADGAGSGAAVTDLSALFSSVAVDGVAIGASSPSTIVGTTITANTSILPDASGGADIGSTSAEFGDIYIADDKKIYFGSGQDVSMEYDEDGTDTLLISGGDVTLADDKKLYFGTDKDVSLEYDEDDTNTLLVSGDITMADDKKLYFGTGKDVHIEYDEDGDNVMVISGAVVFADGSTDVDIASHDTSNGLKLGGTLVTATAAELNIMDGVTATAAELNYSDGVSSNIQTQLDTKHSAVGNGLTEDSATQVSLSSVASATNIGGIIFAVSNATMSVTPNSTTVSGSALNYGGLDHPSSSGGYTQDNARIIHSSTSVGSGTWRANFKNDSSSHYAMGVWQRIS